MTIADVGGPACPGATQCDPRCGTIGVTETIRDGSIGHKQTPPSGKPSSKE
ncbi:hypothetical protein GCM10009641_21470 [Mycobacterium cookii]|uniref:Uncharacterized protein n=1 Tax=Mycobacterium cookii TaxID=1775 RepID=A0A7I7KVA7_9MYCO|nr:hypothetical protein MCOO_12770 [Mycobacterium cookii]